MEKIIGLSAEGFEDAVIELIRRTSTQLPDDIIEGIKKGRDQEAESSLARSTLESILENIDMAKNSSQPICQDTGTVTFDINYPFGLRESDITAAIKSAVQKATLKHYLRENVVDSLTGELKNDNIGAGHPNIHINQWDKPELAMTLVLKGGGCENVGAQYALPQIKLEAGRDINGVKKTILDAVVKALGKGCSPGVLGIAIGGDRAQGYALSKTQLHRKLNDTNPNPTLAELEGWIMEKANTLGIGPMGFGGKTTLLGVKTAAMDRIPASYFVTMTYMCWAYRRRLMTINNGEVTYD